MAELENNSQVTNDVTDNNDEAAKVEKAFRTFKTQEEFDNFAAFMRKKGEESALKNAKVTDGENTFNAEDYKKSIKKDLEAQIRADIERQAKMTEAEKLAEERERMMQEFREERVELNREKARTMLTKAGFDEDDMDVYLDFVNEDTEISLGRIQRVCDTQKARLEKQKKSIIDELQKNSPNMNFADGSSVNALQSQYDEAKKVGNLAKMSSLIREAQAQGIQLK